MPTNDPELQTQAQSILDAIASVSFEQCQPLNREFDILELEAIILRAAEPPYSVQVLPER